MGKAAKTRVVVVGGGHASAAMLSALRKAVAKQSLGAADLSVTLVDPKPAFHAPVMMPGVLGAPEEWAELTVVPWESILDSTTASHLRGVAVAVDTDAKTVTVRVAVDDADDDDGDQKKKKKKAKKTGSKKGKGKGKEEEGDEGAAAQERVDVVPYDLLVLGTGSTNQGFTLPVDERVFASNSVEAVVAQVKALGQQAAGSPGEGKAESDGDGDEKHILVVGGGPTGLEVATAIADFQRENKVTLVHSGPEVLRERGVAEGEYPSPLSAKLVKKLTKKTLAFDNLDLVTGDRVKFNSDGSRPTNGTIKLESGKKVKGVTSIVWATGSRLNNDLWMKDVEEEVEEREEEDASSSDTDSASDSDSGSGSDSDSDSDSGDKKKKKKTKKTSAKSAARKGGKKKGKKTAGKKKTKAVSALRQAANVDGLGDLRVDGCLWVEGLVGSVFAFGDIASHPTPIQKIAAQASEQGRHLASSLAAIVQARAAAEDTDDARDAATTATKLKPFKSAGDALMIAMGGRDGAGHMPFFGGMVVGRTLPLMFKGSAAKYGKVVRDRMLAL